MIGYKDMTFCTATDCKDFGDGKCFRSLTPKVQREADSWWGHGKNQAPIAQVTSPPKECYKPKKSGVKNEC